MRSERAYFVFEDGEVYRNAREKHNDPFGWLGAGAFVSLQYLEVSRVSVFSKVIEGLIVFGFAHGIISYKNYSELTFLILGLRIFLFLYFISLLFLMFLFFLRWVLSGPLVTLFSVRNPNLRFLVLDLP